MSARDKLKLNTIESAINDIRLGKVIIVVDDKNRENEGDFVAAAEAIAKLAREDVPDEVVAAMGGERPHYGKDYIIPSTFDPRLISVIPAAVAKAAMDSGVARKNIINFDIYKEELKQRLDPTVTIMQGINSYIKKKQKRIVFADGEDENTLKAAIAFKTVSYTHLTLPTKRIV